MFDFVTWTVDPILFSAGPLQVRWYGLMWGLGFLIGYEMISRIFKNEHCPKDWADKIFVYMAVGTIIGARVGHCFFYEWDYYSQHLTEILCIWKGGLASHGGAIGILIAMYFFSKYVTKKSYLWIFDRLVMPVALCGMMIRFGNLMNSEIYGGPTTMSWGFKFVREYPVGMPLSLIPACHPTQIYEMAYCLVALVTTSVLYWKCKAYNHQGVIFGTFLVIVFLSRFLLEFIKNDQEAFEQNMLLNMGQILSIPFILLGVGLLVRAWLKYKKQKTV